MWTYTDDLTLVEKLIIKSCFRDGELIHYRIYPVEGYVLRIPELDEYKMDEDGNLVFDENGDGILVTPYRSYGGATEMPDYDWELNLDRYCAELEEDGNEIR